MHVVADIVSWLLVAKAYRIILVKWNGQMELLLSTVVGLHQYRIV